MALIGKVVAMTGVAYVLTDNGTKRELHLGDQIQSGDTIQTLPGVEVDLELINGRVIHIGAEQLVAFTEELTAAILPDVLDNAVNLATIDTVIKAIEQGKDISEVLEETAAGANGPSTAYGFNFVDLLRIGDILNQFGFNFNFDINAQEQAIPSNFFDDNAINAGIKTSNLNPDIATVSLSATPTLTEAGGNIVYTATITQAPVS
ncbi:MAG: hypothetical protein CVU27_04030, partial [Betaproteobacteria bacterium HGW-Betaproteobacteria-20]